MTTDLPKCAPWFAVGAQIGDTPEPGHDLVRTVVHHDTNEVENRMSGGVDGTRTRGLRRDRPAF